MAVELLGNLGESTLNANINNSVTSLTVASAASFPAAVTGTSQFRVIVGTEVMIVTNVSGTTFTVTRGAEGTTAASHSSGDAITHVITAGTLSAMFGGGTAGQVLAKTASADYAQAWQTPGFGGGDVFRPGYYFLGYTSSGFSGAAAMTLDRLYARRVTIPVRRAFDRIGINVTTAASAGGTVRLGIYTSSGGVPAALVLDAGTIASTSTGAKEATISQTLDAGEYWLVAIAQTATCSVTFSGSVSLPYAAQTATTPPSADPPPAFYQALGAGASLPSPWGATLNTFGNQPLVSLRAA